MNIRDSLGKYSKRRNKRKVENTQVRLSHIKELKSDIPNCNMDEFSMYIFKVKYISDWIDELFKCESLYININITADSTINALEKLAIIIREYHFYKILEVKQIGKMRIFND